MKECTELLEENIRLRRENARWYWIGALGWLVNILWVIHFFC
jgi:predicted nucleic acid-binding Zn ribbon protein